MAIASLLPKLDNPLFGTRDEPGPGTIIQPGADSGPPVVRIKKIDSKS
jgi:hypothetical protein